MTARPTADEYQRQPQFSTSRASGILHDVRARAESRFSTAKSILCLVHKGDPNSFRKRRDDYQETTKRMCTVALIAIRQPVRRTAPEELRDKRRRRLDKVGWRKQILAILPETFSSRGLFVFVMFGFFDEPPHDQRVWRNVDNMFFISISGYLISRYISITFPVGDRVELGG